MNVILVADNASTRFGGEAFLPFNYFRLLLARNIDVRLVVHARNRSELAERFPLYLDKLHFVEDTWLHKALFRLGTFLPSRLAETTTGLLLHLTTQSVQRRIVRDLVKRFPIDVIHQPIPVSPRSPSKIYALGAPVIIGPLNGGMDYPRAFKRERGGLISAAVLKIVRATADFVNRIIPGKLHADLVLVANRRSQEVLPYGITGRIVEMVDNGVDFKIWRRKTSLSCDGVLRLVFVGRLIELKAVDLVIEALHRIGQRHRVSLEIIGDGPMEDRWRHFSNQLGLGETVKFSGFMAQEECAKRLRESDVLVMSSLHDCGGAVVLEAMAVGLPVIATAWGGPLDYLDETCGILVEPTSREALIEGFSNAIMRLAGSAPLREQMGQAAYTRAHQHFDWERKIDRILELYESVR